ncbi:MAG: ribosome silencing factor [Betaproteobacteria bacterium]|nr:ribosome silencing factor [Betaproteobacteria bacterium]NBY07162.1 ribosome silencing factor [Betaproteobacteria bacterium]
MTDTNTKKEIQQLQRIIVDALEDVKAQNLVVFNTEHLSSLFERVIIASGTSNRQTKALASSVRDAVREQGFGKPRVEGEENGEWIIVDCGMAVVHIMQPMIRQYYNLEEIWGDKPVRLKLGAPMPVAVKPVQAPVETKKPAAKKSTTKKPVEKKSASKKSTEIKKPATAKKPAAKKIVTKKISKPLALKRKA